MTEVCRGLLNLPMMRNSPDVIMAWSRIISAIAGPLLNATAKPTTKRLSMGQPPGHVQFSLAPSVAQRQLAIIG
jgi:hypothetical protein